MLKNVKPRTKKEPVDAVQAVNAYFKAARDERKRARRKHILSRLIIIPTVFILAGSAIQEAFRSAINGAIRQGLLERDGTMLRVIK
jgi:hypothetical protein